METNINEKVISEPQIYLNKFSSLNSRDFNKEISQFCWIDCNSLAYICKDILSLLQSVEILHFLLIF